MGRQASVKTCLCTNMLLVAEAAVRRRSRGGGCNPPPWAAE